MRPRHARAQDQRHRADELEIVEARADFAAGVDRAQGAIVEPEAAAAEIGLALTRCVQQLRLQRSTGREAEAAIDYRCSVLGVTLFDQS
jgi:hypothetical protein